MTSQSSPREQRITLTAVRELDRLAGQFRRKLRDLAVESAHEAEDGRPVGPDSILGAVPLACRAMLSDSDTSRQDERALDAERDAA